MNGRLASFGALIVLWAAAVAAAVAVRPLMPVDETRYLTVAWEMWNRGDLLVPHLNGAPYSHKPPLLFWLMHLGWAVAGVNDWWPRLVSPLVALANLGLIALLARRLWPGDAATTANAPWIAFGAVLWLAFSTLTMFDMLIVLFVLIGMLGLVEAWRGHAWRGFVLLGVAIGGGVLSKGPVILLHLLPAALLAPWWARDPRPRFGRWYLGVLAALALGAALALAWAVPAGRAGGPEYHDAIFWGQTADRMAKSFAHRQPWWWYLPLLPLILFPWPWWPASWRAFARLRAESADGAVRFLVAWVAPVFIGFTLISGKQPQYLLPLFAALALLAARLLTLRDAAPRRIDPLPVAAVFVALGIALLVLPQVAAARRMPEWVGAIGPAPGILFVVLGTALGAWRPASAAAALRAFTVAAVAGVIVLHVGVLVRLAPGFDLSPIATQLRKLQAEGRAVAHYGKYHGQYTFVGRLQAPLAVIRSGEELRRWAQAHPEGRVVAYDDQLPDGLPVAPEFDQPFRGRNRVQVWDAQVLATVVSANAGALRETQDDG